MKADTLSICVHPPSLEDLNTMFCLHNFYNVHKISIEVIKLFSQSMNVPSIFKFNIEVFSTSIKNIMSILMKVIVAIIMGG